MTSIRSYFHRIIRHTATDWIGRFHMISKWNAVDCTDGLDLVELYKYLTTRWRAFVSRYRSIIIPLLWRHNGPGSVSNHQPHDCLLNRLFRRRSNKTSKLRVTGLCAGDSPKTGEFPTQMASNAENISIWWWNHMMVPRQSLLFCVIIILWEWGRSNWQFTDQITPILFYTQRASRQLLRNHTCGEFIIWMHWTMCIHAETNTVFPS